MSRVYNFSAGPSMLPEEVLKKAQTEMLEYGTSGMSVMEMSHRSKDYQDIIDSAEALVRELMHVPDNYKVLFLQGGGSTQFAMIPLNLASKNKKADYVITGQWRRKQLPRLKDTLQSTELHLLPIKLFHTYQSLINQHFQTMQITSISATTTQFTEQDIQNFHSATFLLSQIFHHA